jgi:dTDP-4-dehydrorhamnose reductase
MAIGCEPREQDKAMKRALVFGGHGLLGAAVRPALEGSGIKVIAPSEEEVDICDRGAVAECVGASGVDFVFNLAAQSNVDLAEREPDEAFRVNALGAEHVASAAAADEIPLLHVSTDYVFDGDTQRPYREVDPTGFPPSQYGQSKLLGEQLVLRACSRCFIVRVAALFGKGRSTFLDWILTEANPSRPLTIVADRFVSPTYTRDAAAQILALARTEQFGTYHATGHGVASWFEFARTGLSLAGADPEGIVPIPDCELKSSAPRPRSSALDNFMLRLRGLDRMRPWREALAAYMGRR